MTKKCTVCGIEKLITSFHKNNTKTGCYSMCKVCRKIQRNSKDGVAKKIYDSQINSCKQRQYQEPTYTKQELVDWLFSQKDFHVLYDNWVRLDYQKRYTPSVDRIDDYLSYTMANIRLVPWHENEDRHHKDRVNGINNKASKAVIKLTLDGCFIEEYYSLSQASRSTGIQKTDISKVCRGKRNKAGGYVWRYK